MKRQARVQESKEADRMRIIVRLRISTYPSGTVASVDTSTREKVTLWL